MNSVVSLHSTDEKHINVDRQVHVLVGKLPKISYLFSLVLCAPLIFIYLS